MNDTVIPEETIPETTEVIYGDLFLKFQSKEQADEVLYNLDSTLKFNLVVDTVGIIYKQTGVTLLGEDGEYPETKPLDGWHVNTRGEIPEALLVFSVQPENPVRVWA